MLVKKEDFEFSILLFFYNLYWFGLVISDYNIFVSKIDCMLWFVL